MNNRESKENKLTPQDQLFDTLSRILARPIPRRQALKLMVGTTAGALLSQVVGMRPSRAAAQTSGQTAVALPGDLLVSDATTGQVLHFGALTGSFLGAFTGTVNGLGMLSDPYGMVIGPDFDLYVCGYASNGVFKYNGRTGRFLGVFASCTSPTGQVFGPDGYLYVANDSDYSIWRFNGSTGVFKDIVVPGGAGGLNHPQGLAIGPDGNLYIADSGNSKILRCNVSTGAVDTFVSSGSGGLNRPTGLVFGTDGNLYVSSAGTNSILRYNATTGTPSQNAFVSSGSGGLNNPLGLSFDVNGNLYVVSNGNGNILRYDATGAFLNVFASSADNLSFMAFVPPQDSIYTNQGGNTGQVSVRVTTDVDFSLVAGAQITLSATGKNGILGANVSVLSPHYLTTTFDLTGATPGVYDVVITQPGSPTRTLPKAFTVEQGGASNLTAQVIGRSAIRGGIPQTYFVLASNTGTVDSGAANLIIEFTNLFAWQLSGYTAHSIVTGPDNISISIPIPAIPAGGSQTIPIQFTIPDLIQYGHMLTNIIAWVNPAGTVGVTYIGYGDESLLLQLIDTDQNGISVFGTNGVPTQILVQTATGDSVSFWLDDLGRPARIQDGSGEKIILKWLSDTQVLVTEISAEGEPQGSIVVNTDGSGGSSNNITLAHTSAGCLLAVDLCTDLGTTYSYICYTAKLGAILAGVSLITAYTPVAPILAALVIVGKACGSNIATLFAPFWFNKVCGALSSLCAEFFTAHDPNDIAGVSGFDTPRWVPGSQQLTYTVFFGNETTASAPAQTVVITNKLDVTKVDLKTFSLGVITFGTNIVTPLPNVRPVLGINEFDYTVDIRPQGNNLLVNVHATLDTDTGYLIWRFTSLDPSTGLPTANPQAGFLPPGGEGSVMFTLYPKQNLPTGTVINDQAIIVFDVNAPMSTPVWSNTLDNDAPVSQVLPLASTQQTGGFTVQWTGTDTINNVPGSGLQGFTIYVSEDNGAYTPWLADTTDTQDIYPGAPGHVYAFTSQAQDNSGNLEPMHTQPDTFTAVVVALSALGVPNILLSGVSTTGQVSLDGPAFTDTLVLLTNTNPAVTIPANVTIPAGQSSVTFSIKAKSVITATKGTLTASYAGVNQAQPITVLPSNPITPKPIKPVSPPSLHGPGLPR
jgi:sugar lactone lactonase YvrE